MAKKDGQDYLYLTWKSEHSGKQYKIGKLIKNNIYEFRYSDDIEIAQEDGFTPLLCFPYLHYIYKSKILFPIFASRLPDKKRRDIKKILKKYNLEEYDEYMLLKKSGAKLPIDNLEFIDP